MNMPEEINRHSIWKHVNSKTGFDIPEGYWEELKSILDFRLNPHQDINNDLEFKGEDFMKSELFSISEEPFQKMQAEIWEAVKKEEPIPQLPFSHETGFMVPDGYFENSSKNRKQSKTRFEIFFRPILQLAASIIFLMGVIWFFKPISVPEKEQIAAVDTLKKDTPFQDSPLKSNTASKDIEEEANQPQIVIIPAAHEIEAYLEENPEEILLDEL